VDVMNDASPLQNPKVLCNGLPRETAAGGELRDGVTQLEAQTPLGRIAQPEDIAPVAVFLASQEAGWLTGELVTASGGLR
jgi:NAD(P)-dependent dehydrogenase (short-subunit alcohol dehydrogenase family)